MKEPRNLQHNELCATGRGRQLFLIIHLNGRTLRALIDSGSAGNYIDMQTAINNGLRILKKRDPYRLVLVDGGPIESNRGQVTYGTDWITMKVLRGHTEEIQFDLTSLQTYQVVLGAPWLRQHNPQIDWIRERITLNQCQCGSDRRAPKGNPIFPTVDELCTTESEQTEDLTQASVLKNRLRTR